MEWKQIKTNTPDENKSVLVFRFKKRVYIVARYSKDLRNYDLKDHCYKYESDTIVTKPRFCWQSVSNMNLKMDEEDWWLEFPPFMYQKLFN